MDIESTKIHFISGGSKLSGWVFRSNVQSSNSLAVLLHGYPGSDRDPLGLGSRLSDGGIDVITFNYRGTWESEGIHSYKNSIDDILAVSSYLHSDKMAQDLVLC